MRYPSQTDYLERIAREIIDVCDASESPSLTSPYYSFVMGAARNAWMNSKIEKSVFSGDEFFSWAKERGYTDGAKRRQFFRKVSDQISDWCYAWQYAEPMQ